MRSPIRNLLIAALLCATPAVAQDNAKTLADIRQELTVLYVEMQKLKRELSTTGGVNVNLQGTNALERVDAMEAELQRLTAATERLTNRVDSVVSDGTNRIGDLEFRLCELEPNCDIGKLGETTTLGGGAMPAASGGGIQTGSIEGNAAPAAGGFNGASDVAEGLVDLGSVELAVSEKADFERAKASYDGGSYEDAAEKFQMFTDTYQGGPLTGLAHLMRGESLSKMGLTSSAARAYLESYSGTPDGPTAPVALLKLGLSLDGLGQTSEACITLGEVSTRFPASEASIEAQAARADMGCS
jgi:tol-pal system protein YbgF